MLATVPIHMCYLPIQDDTVFDEYLLWSRDVQNRILCVAECAHDSQCASITFTNTTNRCKGYSLTFGVKGQSATQMADTRYYVLSHGTLSSRLFICFIFYC
mgnify:CR=1 FL=1